MGVQRSANETSLLNTRKKRQYNERILNVERGSFKPFVLSANGGKECKKITEGYQIQMLRKEKNVIQKSYHG